MLCRPRPSLLAPSWHFVGAPRGAVQWPTDRAGPVGRKTHFCDWGLSLACTVKFRGFPMCSGLGPLPSAEIIAAARPCACLGWP